MDNDKTYTISIEWSGERFEATVTKKEAVCYGATHEEAMCNAKAVIEHITTAKVKYVTPVKEE